LRLGGYPFLEFVDEGVIEPVHYVADLVAWYFNAEMVGQYGMVMILAGDLLLGRCKQAVKTYFSVESEMNLVDVAHEPPFLPEGRHWLSPFMMECLHPSPRLC